MCILTLPRDQAKPGTSEVLFNWDKNSEGTKEATLNASRLLTDNETDSVAEVGDMAPTVDFEADIISRYSYHLQEYFHKQCIDVYNDEQEITYGIDCNEEYMLGASDCLWAGTEYTSYAAFKNIADNYTTEVAETD